ncbi:hypothetical protein SRHO_G00182620 [Serrasalmus rhombeus]
MFKEKKEKSWSPKSLKWLPWEEPCILECCMTAAVIPSFQSEPYIGPIPGGLRAGLILFFQGVVPSDSDGFSMNLKTGPRDGDDVAFRFNPRQCSVVCDSFRNGKWENPKETLVGPFRGGTAFDIIIANNPDGYEVVVNGHDYCTFKHCIPLEEVSVLNIIGDVFMNTFSIFEVNSVNMKATISAHL